MLISKITQALSADINANFARIRGLSFLIYAILKHRTVNLTILSTTDDGKDVSNQSRYRRFQDFFLNAVLDYKSIGQFILSRIPKPKDGYPLAMDRTNWKFGRRDINFLVISIIAGNVAVPLVWKVLPKATKRGNSNTRQRIAITKRLLKIMSARDIHVLTMDREFVGTQWFEYLNDNGIRFIARIKANNQINEQKASSLATALLKRKLHDGGLCHAYGLELFFACKRIDAQGARAEQLIVLSNYFRGQQALKIYKKRWGIERLFWHLKKKGFDLESTHMTQASKLDKLFAVLTLAFLISFAWGCRLRHIHTSESQQSKRKSCFRLGLENILRMIQQSYAEYPTRPRAAKREMRVFTDWIQKGLLVEIFLV